MALAGVRPRAAGRRPCSTRCCERWPDDAYALASRAHLRAQARPARRGLADAQALVAAHPQRSAADWFNLAYLLEDAGRLAEAEPAFRRALALDPKLDRAWYGLGLVLIRLQRLDEAVAALKRNTELQPMSPYGWYQLARVHVDRQRARGGAQDHPPPEGLRAQGGRATGARDRAGCAMERAA